MTLRLHLPTEQFECQKNTGVNLKTPAALFATWSVNLIEEGHPKDKSQPSAAEAFFRLEISPWDRSTAAVLLCLSPLHSTLIGIAALTAKLHKHGIKMVLVPLPDFYRIMKMDICGTDQHMNKARPDRKPGVLLPKLNLHRFTKKSQENGKK